MKILTVLGARPQFVKAAVFSRHIKQVSGFEEVIVHTGQHFDENMSQVFFEQMEIPKPRFHLQCGGLSQGAMTGKMLEEIERILVEQKPDMVLVYGDTNSTLAGALAAVKLNIAVAHVEAGLRSFNTKMPEEVNRIVTDRISSLLFCPSEISQNHLLSEGISKDSIYNVGDIMYEAILYYAEKAKPTEKMKTFLNHNKDFVLCTIHRAENITSEQSLKSLFGILNTISQKKKIILPLHPHTKSKLIKSHVDLSHIEVIEPVPYFDMLSLLKNCSLVMTDSGGLQKEAYFMKKPCITLRGETEWVETVNVGANTVTGIDENKINNAFKGYSDFKVDFSQKLYGDGQTAAKICKVLKSF